MLIHHSPFTYSPLSMALFRAGRLAVVFAPSEADGRFLVTVFMEDTTVTGTAVDMPEAAGIVETAVSRIVADYGRDMGLETGMDAAWETARYFGVDVTDIAAVHHLRQMQQRRHDTVMAVV